MSAIVLGMASCGEGNEPESKDFQFKIEALSTSAHYIVTPVNNDAYYYCSCYVYTDGYEKTLKELTESKNYQVIMSYNSIVKGQPIEQYMYDKPSDTRFIVWACYVEEGENGKIKVVGDISYKIFKTMPEGTLNGEFSVNAQGKKVHFGKGNLKRDEDLSYRFFDHQWEYRHDSYYYPIDLIKMSDMEAYNQSSDPWFVLSYDEWKYLLFERPNAEKLFAHATLTINDDPIWGFMLLPDKWEDPDNMHVTTDFEMGITLDDNERDKYAASSNEFDGFAKNVFDQSQWEKLEFAGAVFLPATNISINGETHLPQASSYYWTSTTSSVDSKYIFYYQQDLVRITKTWALDRCTIRPVRVVK